MRLKGFTLIELLVVIGIIAALMSVVLPQFTRFDQGKTLQDAASELQTNLRVAQNNATSGVVCKTGTSASNWYIHFLHTGSRVYYETGSDCQDSSAPTPGPVAHYFPASVSVKNITLGSCTFPLIDVEDTSYSSRADNFWVRFKNISGDVGFEGLDEEFEGCDQDDASQMVITLQLNSDTSQTADVKVKKGGPIYIGVLDPTATPTPTPPISESEESGYSFP